MPGYIRDRYGPLKFCVIAAVIIFVIFSALFYQMSLDVDRMHDAEKVCRNTPGSYVMEGQTGGYQGCMKKVPSKSN